MCGAEEQLFRADVEGTELNVCSKCAKFGKVISRVRDPPKRVKKQRVETTKTSEKVQIIALDYSKRVRDARTRMGLTQLELSRKLAEKESLVQKIESGQFEPSIRLARKLENHLRIKIVEQHEEKHEKKFKASSGPLTIGDMIQLK